MERETSNKSKKKQCIKLNALDSSSKDYFLQTIIFYIHQNIFHIIETKLPTKRSFSITSPKLFAAIGKSKPTFYIDVPYKRLPVTTS